MQKVAAYLLERKEDVQWFDERMSEFETIVARIEEWMKGKGVSSVSTAGKYEAVDGSDASYQVTEMVDGKRLWRKYTLSEVTREGRVFVTTLSVMMGRQSVVVFVEMEVGLVSSSINRIEVDPKCPRIVRELLSEPRTWYHGASRLRTLSSANGFDAGESLALEIQHPERTLPIVIVSTVDGQVSLPRLDVRIARDLAGVANVYAIDEEASWALTDVLRAPFSCFGGAIRIYWPRLTRADEPRRHPLWTAERVRGIDSDARKASERIRRQIRRVIMSASASSVVRPKEFDDIRKAVERAKLAALEAKAASLEGLKAKAKSLEEFRKLADSYADDNDQLRRELSERTTEIDTLRGEIQKLESQKQALQFHLNQAGAEGEEALVQPDAPTDEIETPPVPGEVRYYKKVHAGKSRDVMKQVADCGHNSWQNAAKADKAKKGIAHLVGPENEWKTLYHCGVCTGGGMWKVRW